MIKEMRQVSKSSQERTSLCQVHPSVIISLLDEYLRFVIPFMIIEKDYDSLRMATAFKLFVLLIDHSYPSRKSDDFVIGSSIRELNTKVFSSGKLRHDLEEQTQVLCLQPEMIEFILPRLLTGHTDQSQVKFFLDVVIQKKMSLNKIIAASDKLILKGLIRELGDPNYEEKESYQAIQVAAVVRENFAKSGQEHSLLQGLNESGTPVIRDAQTMASIWVSSHFMYLLVNVVQQHWQDKTLEDRIRAFRSLNLMIKFLSPSDAPQFLTQIIATVGMATAYETSAGLSDLEILKVWSVRLLAAENLSAYSKLLLKENIDVISLNLATMVVPLFPFLDGLDDNVSGNLKQESKIRTKAAETACSLLEDLTSGDVGKKLAGYFKEIPFLPSSPLLDGVRKNLISYGVDFSNLVAYSSSQGNTQSFLSGRESLSNDGVLNESFVSNDRREEAREKMMASLRDRLRLIRPLLDHESSSVRLATLQYLLDLMSTNRAIFCSVVEKEDPSSIATVLTVPYRKADYHGSQRVIASLLEGLLSMVAVESNREVKALLSKCFGEITAIDPRRLGTVATATDKTTKNKALNSSQDCRSWQLSRPPWQSSVSEYALRLLTKRLVVALKVATNSSEQHYAAYTIQQILVIVNDTCQREEKENSSKQEGKMSPWLNKQLKSANVLDVIEPYWESKFNEKSKTMASKTTQPPFFHQSLNYHIWISRWCRYMILRAHEDSACTWRGLLHACRTVVRSPSALSISEFIVPILVLERLCFGTPDDEAVIVQELKDVFKFSGSPAASSGPVVHMSHNEKQKAVTTAFNLIDTLKWWSNEEQEENLKHKSNRNSSAYGSTCWTRSKSVEKISDLLQHLSLESMASTAAAMGLHARALLCLETKARAGLAEAVFDTTSAKSKDNLCQMVTARHGLGNALLEGINISLLKEVLAKLDDYSTMKASAKNDRFLIFDENNIRERESRGDWAGALTDYERALRSHTTSGTRAELERGSLRCLLKIGLHENVLNQVNGIIHTNKNNKGGDTIKSVRHSIPTAVDAAWRLGRWDALDDLLKEYKHDEGLVDSEDVFKLELGKAMLGLHRHSKAEVDKAVQAGRDAIMNKLSILAKDSYERSYPNLIKLQCIREIEDAASFLCDNDFSYNPGGMFDLANSTESEGWAWDVRLNLVSSFQRSPISDVRLALARLSGDKKLARDQLFTMGKRARKNGLLDLASTYFAQCSSVYDPSFAQSNEIRGDIQMQFAKLEYQSGHSGSALRILGVENIKGWGNLNESEVRSEAIKRFQNLLGQSIPGAEQLMLTDMAKRLLKSTQWIAEAGLQPVTEVMERFQVTNILSPKWEKCHFEFGKYIDSLLETRISGVAQHEGLSADEDDVRKYVFSEDKNCQNYLIMAMEQYLGALKVVDTHVYQVLPRLLSLWFEYTSVEREENATLRQKRPDGHETPMNISSDPTGFLLKKKNEANELFQRSMKSISVEIFYKAMPQLISRVCHPNTDTCYVVQTLLTRLLLKFPAQAMWALAWVRNSVDKTRSRTGHEIFKGAQKSLLARAESNKVHPRRKMILEKNEKILNASKYFVSFLVNIAKYSPKDERARSFKLGRWRCEVELSDFVPPIQSALTTPIDPMNCLDAFPRFRAFHSGVQIMSSKAKPKRVKFYVTPGGHTSSSDPGISSISSSEDVGELHFLLKNEQKGDLRKDARVQDLNNVINRLMAATTTKDKGKMQRRLSLRTFAVTCLSEDCGILEWVPNTESFRSLTTKAYNPQAAIYSKKRHGRRLANFGDPNLKKNYETCQNNYFKHGNLMKAARLFELHFLDNFPPLFYWWFVHHFQDAHAWYEARNNFTTSAAVWSAVGHVIGLGDRHSENLLIDTSNGSCVHVDFDCIFDKGLTLPKPEVIPFRLTPNMIDGFGPVGGALAM